MNNKPSFGTIMKTGLTAGVIAAAINTAIWIIGQVTSGMVVPIVFVIAISIIGVLIGGLIYFGLSRFLGTRTNLVFSVISIVFLIAYAFMPISAMNSEPMPGMGVFNVATVIATELMHIVAGYLAITRYTKLTSN